MSLPIPALALTALGLIATYRFIVYPLFLSPLRHIPAAHWSVRLSPIWVLWARYSGRENRAVHSAHAKLGPVVLLGPSEIDVDCVEGGVKTVYAGGWEKHAWYPNVFENYGVPNMFATAASRPHGVRKRMLSNVYSKSHLQSSGQLLAASSRLLHARVLPRLTAYAASAASFDIYGLFSATTMDFVTAYIFGLASSTNFLQEKQKCDEWLQLYTSRHPYIFWPQELPRLTKWLAAIGMRVVPRWVDDANGAIEAFAMGMCDRAERVLQASSRGEEVGPEDFPTVYAQLKSAMTGLGAKASRDAPGAATGPDAERVKLEVASELLDQLSAGFDTSSITLAFVVYELCRHPSVQQALHDELLALDPPLVVSPTSPLPGAKDLDACPLLNAVVQETLRLHTAIPGGQPRVTPADGKGALGPRGEYKDLPAGVRVEARAWCLHQNGAVFPEPEKWRPERWLETEKDGDDERRKEMGRWFWAFGSGGRMCVGSNLAIYQMKYILAALYTNFRTRLADETISFKQVDAYTAPPAARELLVKLEEWQ